MFLLQSSYLGANKSQRLMNSKRDRHLYSCLCTCTNMSFRCISHSFIQNCIKFVQVIFRPLNIALFICWYSILGIWELKLAKDGLIWIEINV